ncbi:MAG: cation transporter, partial [Minisyncoccia bacterium]
MNTPKTYKIKGMHCASCAGIIEKTFKKIDGVHSAEVNYGTESAKVDFDETKTSASALSQTVEKLGYTLVIPTAKSVGMSENIDAEHLDTNQSKIEKLAEINAMRSGFISIIPLAVFSLFVMGWDILAEYHVVTKISYTTSEFFHHIFPVFATYALFVVGKPYLLGFYRFLRYGTANMDTLIGIGTSAAFLYSLIVTSLEETLKP